VEDIHVIGKKWLEMVIKRTFRPVTNFGDQSLPKFDREDLELNFCYEVFALIEMCVKHNDMGSARAFRFQKLPKYDKNDLKLYSCLGPRAIYLFAIPHSKFEIF
jgi:hypothetical protein